MLLGKGRVVRVGDTGLCYWIRVVKSRGHH